jgi:hypothetical protein
MRAAYPNAKEEEWPADVRGAIERRLLEIAADPPAASAQPVDDPTPEDPRVAELALMSEDVRAEAEALLSDPNLLCRVSRDIESIGVAGERPLALLVYLVAVSSRLPKPLSLLLKGPTSSGKSYVVETVADLAPPETVIRATSITGNALFYCEPGTLRHKLVLGGERSRLENDETAERSRALREMISAGRITKLVPTKEDDRMVTRLLVQEGPISFVESTTLGAVFEEDANRYLIVATDERPPQTRRVLRATAARAAGRQPRDVARVRAVHHALGRMVPRRDVAVPFADVLAELLPDDRVEVRRSFPHLLALVSSSALLHHRQRPIDAGGNVVADLRDYQVALVLAGDALGIAHGGVTPGTRRFFDRLRGKYPELEFDSNEAQAVGGGSRSTARSRLAELNEAGLIEQTAAPRGKVAARWKLTGDRVSARSGGLPPVEEVARWVAPSGGPATDPSASGRPEASESGVGRANPGGGIHLPPASARPEGGANGTTLLDLSFLCEGETASVEGPPPLSGRRGVWN